MFCVAKRESEPVAANNGGTRTYIMRVCWRAFCEVRNLGHRYSATTLAQSDAIAAGAPSTARCSRRVGTQARRLAQWLVTASTGMVGGLIGVLIKCHLFDAVGCEWASRHRKLLIGTETALVTLSLLMSIAALVLGTTDNPDWIWNAPMAIVEHATNPGLNTRSNLYYACNEEQIPINPPPPPSPPFQPVSDYLGIVDFLATQPRPPPNPPRVPLPTLAQIHSDNGITNVFRPELRCRDMGTTITNYNALVASTFEIWVDDEDNVCGVGEARAIIPCYATHLGYVSGRANFTRCRSIFDSSTMSYNDYYHRNLTWWFTQYTILYAYPTPQEQVFAEVLPFTCSCWPPEFCVNLKGTHESLAERSSYARLPPTALWEECNKASGWSLAFLITLVGLGACRALLFFNGLRTDAKKDHGMKGLNLWCNVACLAGGIMVIVNYDATCIRGADGWDGYFPAMRTVWFDGYMSIEPKWGPTLMVLAVGVSFYFPCVLHA